MQAALSAQAAGGLVTFRNGSGVLGRWLTDGLFGRLGAIVKDCGTLFCQDRRSGGSGSRRGC
jgi:hypothetical protein